MSFRTSILFSLFSCVFASISPQISQAASPLIDVESLAKKVVSAEAPVLLDIRLRKDYDKGHITGARWIDINAWTAASLGNPATGGIGLNNAEFWSKQVSSAGLQLDSEVVVIGGSITSSCRLWWLLKYCGIKDVQLLDGGFDAWQAAKLEIGNSKPKWEATNTKVDFQDAMLAELDDVSKADVKCAIIDSRSSAEYTGTRGVGTRRGHIPGAKHIEWKQFVGKDGKFLPKEKLIELLGSNDVASEAPIITHCQTGGRSSVVVLAMEILGRSDVKNYYRGWGEYSEALTAPVEK